MRQELSKSTIETVKDSAELITSHALEITKIFYTMLFKKQPTIEKLFVNASGNQYMLLAETIEIILKEKATLLLIDAWKEAYRYLSNILIDMESMLYEQAREQIETINYNIKSFNDIIDQLSSNIESFEVDNWDSLMIYGDGLIEHENELINSYTPELLIQKHQFIDDVTMIYINNV